MRYEPTLCGVGVRERQRKARRWWQANGGRVAALIVWSVAGWVPLAVAAQPVQDALAAEQLLRRSPSLTSQASEPQVRWINGEYTESHIDLRVQVLGGPLDIVRSWSQGRWWLNPAWAPLNFELDPLGREVKVIERAGALYERSGQADLYIAKGKNNAPVFIKRLAETGSAHNHQARWRWYDRLGNTIDYDGQGRILGYADPSDNTVRFAYDSATQARILDHHGGTVYTATMVNGLITHIQDRAGRSVSYQWTGTLLSQVTDVAGQGWSYTYDGNGQITSRTDPLRSRITVQYSQSMPAPPPQLTLGAVGYVLDPAGTSGTTSKLSNQWGAGRVGKFDGPGCFTTGSNQYLREKRQFLVTYVDCRGNTTVYLYDREGNELDRRFNDKQMAGTRWDGNYQTRATDARGLTTTTSYDYNYQPLQITHPDGSRDQYEYESVRGLKTRHTNQNGITSTWSHDDKGRVITWTEALGRPEQRTTHYRYDSYGQLTQSSIGAGDGTGQDARTTVYRYDNQGNLVETTDAQGHSNTASYDATGLPTTVTDALGRSATLAYDAAGRLIQVTNALGQSASHQYDARGRRIQTISAAGRTQHTRYDAQGRVTETIAPGQEQGAGTRITYDSTGQPISTTSPSGLVTSTTYDSQGRITSSVDAAGNVIAYEYGAPETPQAGLLIAIRYPSYKETHQYDQSGRQTAVTQHLAEPSTPEQTRTERHQYDSMGQRIGSTDAAGRTTIYVYDGLGRLLTTLDPLGGTTQQTWNAHDQLTSLTDAKGNTHHFEYDKAGRLIKETRPLGGAIQYRYDAAGQLVQRTDAGGNTRSYAYDAAGRLVQEEHQLTGPQAEQSSIDQRITYQYDPDGLLMAYEQKDGQQALISSATYGRDAQGRTTLGKLTYGKADDTTGDVSFTIGHSYNVEGQLAGHTYPDGSTGQYRYDQGRLSQVTLPDQSQIRYGQYRWLTATRIETPGAIKTISVDALQRPLAIEVKNTAAQLLASRRYQYDPAGNITQIDSDLGKTEYGYDELDRLTRAAPDQPLKDLGLPTELYQYDPVHNRIASGHQLGRWAYNADNQLTNFPQLKPFSASARPTQTQVEYTAQGHTAKETSDEEEKTYGYNAAERLIRYARTTAGQGTPDVEAHYRYDPFGRRIAKAVQEGKNAKITYFFYSDTGLLGEANAQGQMTRAYAFNPDKAQQGLWSTDPIWQADVGQGQVTDGATRIHYLHADHLGTPVLGTDREGATTWKAVAEAFGSSGTLSESQAEMNLRFAGQYWDGESETHYNFHRNYSSIKGSYLQTDPLGIMGGINLYGYANANAISKIDPWGLVSWSGTVYAGSLVSGAGIGLMIFSLESECACGVKVRIKGVATFGAVGFGLKLTGSAGSSKFYDSSSCPKVTAANGPAGAAAISVVTGGGFAVSATMLGGLRSEWPPISTGIIGVDISAVGMIGWSRGSGVVESCCE